MKLKYVTLTGADASVKPEQLLAISQKYPYVEWAILFSQSKAGISRYPSYDWVVDLMKINVDKKMNLSAHLCGKWVESALEHRFIFLRNALVYDAFSRVQLNMGQDRIKDAFKSQSVLDVIQQYSKHDFIFGGNYTNVDINAEYLADNSIFALFDTSGGRGIETKEWPKPFDGCFCGYAGGLGPDNITTELARIAEVVGDVRIWIDMETKLRDENDNFSIEKCEQILQAAKPYVG